MLLKIQTVIKDNLIIRNTLPSSTCSSYESNLLCLVHLQLKWKQLMIEIL